MQDFKPEPEGAYFSWAPLAGVLSARTLYDADSGLCRGILFRYENGGERAVGQCRLGADRRMSVLRPTRVCLRDTTYLTRLRKQERAGVEVEFGAGGEACRHGEGWRCLALRGVMKFSFTAYSSYVSVEDYLAEE